MDHELRTLMEPFATAIYAKSHALRKLDLRGAPRSRFLESISDDIKKASNLHPHGVSEAALERALREQILDLGEKRWSDQRKFDPDRKIFIVEHMVPVKMLRRKCLDAGDEEAVLAVLVSDIRVVWILRTEDDALTALGYRSERPPTAYEEAGIRIRERE
jgi:hypothetical protein